ncbi:uncharacterized protein LOC128889493 isoform X1 [Hylaeus anthracinus]|uniref:uncharacterized protein LOC128889493 isoform X1 n=2 Tax=Hylaeus anthracinus TaxID=313031 RepID=UPI0023B8968B|nr:uncharacterized protein LOC128889493 isoform X1 [Hylaeus anthracinus]
MRWRVRSQVYILLSVARAADLNFRIVRQDTESFSTRLISYLHEHIIISNRLLNRSVIKKTISVARMQSSPNVIFLYFVVFVLGTETVLGEPEPMSRPEVTSTEDIKQVVDHYLNYLKFVGRPRYGKRVDDSSAISSANRALDTLKTILDASQQSQQPRFEKRTPERSRLLHELESSDNRKHGSRIDDRPCHVLDVVENYYDDVQ